MPGKAKVKDFKGTLSRLVGYLKPYSLGTGLVLLITVVGVFLGAIAPEILGRITTELFRPVMEGGGPIDFGFIGRTALLLTAIYASSNIFGYLTQYIMAGLSQKVVFDMRRDVDEKLARLPLKFLDSHTHGELLSRFTNDIDTISSAMQQVITQVLNSLLTIVMVLGVMMTISFRLTLISMIIVPSSAFAMKFIVKRSQKFFGAQQKVIGQLNGHVEEMYSGHMIIKAFNHESKAIERFDEVNEKLYDVGWRAQFFSAVMWPIIHIIGNLGFIAIAVVGGVMVTHGALGIGNVQAFIMYNRQLSQPIAGIAQMVNMIQQSVAAAERVFELLDEQEMIPEPEVPQVITQPQGQVVFENVRFGYGKKPVINNMNLKAEPGQMVAIVGPTGAGKTTLINLLLRFYEIDQGHIYIDETDISQMERSHLRHLFGMVLQDTWLFNGSIRDNIAYGREGATEAEVVAAAKAAHADHFIRTLPDGYDTILNEEVSNISQGQKQLLTIARALLADPQIMILDEATSSVDTRTEKQIQNAMKTLLKGRTSFVIAHRLSTIREADLILVMKDGDVIEQGNHEELIAQNGFYAELSSTV